MAGHNRRYDDGGIVYVESETRPEIGKVCVGYKLREAVRGCGFNQTDEEIACRTTHVIDSKHIRTGFYVVGHRCQIPEGE